MASAKQALPAGLRAVSREGMHSVLSTPTTAAPSGTSAARTVGAALVLHSWLVLAHAAPSYQPHLSSSRHAPARADALPPPHPAVAVATVSRGTSNVDIAGLSEILEGASTVKFQDNR